MFSSLCSPLRSVELCVVCHSIIFFCCRHRRRRRRRSRSSVACSSIASILWQNAWEQMSCRFLKSLTLIMFNVTSNIMQCSYVLSCLRGLAKSQHTYLESKPFVCLWSSFGRISLENFRFSFWLLRFSSARSLSLSLLLSFFLLLSIQPVGSGHLESKCQFTYVIHFMY